MSINNVLIKIRNAANNAWDTILPITTAENVLFGEAGDSAKSKIDDLDTLVSSKANKSRESWTAATLVNGWTGAVNYSKDDFGVVSVRVACKGGTLTDNTVIANLPSGYRPLIFIQIIPVIIPDTGSSDFGVYCTSSGDICVAKTAAVSNVSTVYTEFSFSSI